MDIRISGTNLGNRFGLRRKCKETKHFTGFLASNRFATDIISKYGTPQEMDLPDADMVYREENEDQSYEELLDLIRELLKLDRARTEIHTDIFHNTLIENSVLKCNALFTKLSTEGSFVEILDRLETVYKELRRQEVPVIENGQSETVTDSEAPEGEQESPVRDSIEKIIRESRVLGLSVKDDIIRNIHEGFRSFEIEKIEKEGDFDRETAEKAEETKRAKITSNPFVIWKSEEAKNFFWKVQRLSPEEKKIVLQSFGGISLTHLENRLSSMDTKTWQTYVAEVLENIRYAQYEEESNRIYNRYESPLSEIREGDTETVLPKEEVIRFLQNDSTEVTNVIRDILVKILSERETSERKETVVRELPGENEIVPTELSKESGVEEITEVLHSLSSEEWKTFSEQILTEDMIRRFEEILGVKIYRNEESIRKEIDKVVSEKELFTGVLKEILTSATEETQELIRKETGLLTENTLLGEYLIHRAEETQTKERNEETVLEETLRKLSRQEVTEILARSADEIAEAVFNMSVPEWQTFTQEVYKLTEESILSKELTEKLERVRKEEAEAGSLPDANPALATQIMVSSEKNAFIGILEEIVLPLQTKEGEEKKVTEVPEELLEETVRINKEANLLARNTVIGEYLVHRKELSEHQETNLKTEQLTEGRIEEKIQRNESVETVTQRNNEEINRKYVAELSEIISKMTVSEWNAFVRQLTEIKGISRISEEYLRSEEVKKVFNEKNISREELSENELERIFEIEKKLKVETESEKEIRSEKDVINTIDSENLFLRETVRDSRLDHILLKERTIEEELSKILSEKELSEQMTVLTDETSTEPHEKYIGETLSEGETDRVLVLRKELSQIRSEKKEFLEKVLLESGNSEILRASDIVPASQKQNVTSEEISLEESEELITASIQKNSFLKNLETVLNEALLTQESSELVRRAELIRKESRLYSEETVMGEHLTHRTEETKTVTEENALDILEEELERLAEVTVNMTVPEWQSFTKDVIQLKETGLLKESILRNFTETLSTVENRRKDVVLQENTLEEAEHFLTVLRERKTLSEHIQEVLAKELERIEKENVERSEDRTVERLESKNSIKTELVKLLSNERLITAALPSKLIKTSINLPEEAADKTSVEQALTILEEQREQRVLLERESSEMTVEEGVASPAEKEHKLLLRSVKEAQSVQESPELPEPAVLVNTAPKKTVRQEESAESLEDIRRVVRESQKTIEEHTNDIEFITKTVSGQEVTRETNVSLTKLQEKVDLQEKQIQKLMKEKDDLVKARKTDSWYTKKAVSKINDQLRMEKLRRGL